MGSGTGRWSQGRPQRRTGELGNALLVCWGISEPEIDRRRIGDARECRLNGCLRVIVRRPECHLRPQHGPPRGGSNYWGTNTSWVDHPDIGKGVVELEMRMAANERPLLDTSERRS